MIKKVLVLIFAILVLPYIFAEDLEIKSITQQGTFIYELGTPAVFELEITNNQNTGTFEIYNLLGFTINPNAIELKGDKTTIELEVTPSPEFNYEGTYILPYFIGRGDFQSEQELLLRTIKLENAFQIGVEGLDPDSNSVELFVKNLEDFDFGEVNFKFNSAFFNEEKTFNLGPKEKKSFTIELDKEEIKELIAGFYTIKTEITIGEVVSKMNSIIKFEEKDLLVESRENYGFILTTEIITKSNQGNTIIPSEVIVNKNIISRLFTSFNIDPTSVERVGGKVIYTWDKDVNPGENFEIKVRTNWLFPFIVILLVIGIILLVKRYTKHDVNLRKKVTFVKAKGGEFALKVTVHVHAKKYVERVSLTDKLPPLVKVYEKFGREKPERVDEANKKIVWEFEKLEAGEIRIINYIIYSKIGVMGKFALPSATAIYEREGEIKESNSNKVFFIAEQKKDIK